MLKSTVSTSVLVISSGLTINRKIGEFDDSGTEICRALKGEGIRVVLVDSNPASVMADPDLVDAFYLEPVTPEHVEQVIAKEHPDALLPVLGGRTALEVAVTLAASGVLERYEVELIGADIEAIACGRDRARSTAAVDRIGTRIAGVLSPASVTCHSFDECLAGVAQLGGYPVTVRLPHTVVGIGPRLANDERELADVVSPALARHPISEVILEESMLALKWYELEFMRDHLDNIVTLCSIENLDPMGVHTGDSIVVAPAMTLTGHEYQQLCDIGRTIFREAGPPAGGCNIQFAVDSADGRIVATELTPWVSRSSALASAATGFPIVKIAVKIALGYTLDAIPIDITGKTAALFEPTFGHVVVKVPWSIHQRCPSVNAVLTNTTTPVDEAVAVGRCFPEALQKALRSLSEKGNVLSWPKNSLSITDAGHSVGQPAVAAPVCDRIAAVLRQIRTGAGVAEISSATKIAPWFVDQLVELDKISADISVADRLSVDLLRRAKRYGFSDEQIAEIRGTRAETVRKVRRALNVHPVYRTVDSWGADFVTGTWCHYSEYRDQGTGVAPRARTAVLILGPGPHRIGKGFEFDYSCAHTSAALREAGYASVIVNCNLVTASTDRATCDRLYFEPLTVEDVLEVVHVEAQAGPIAGVIAQHGGQIPVGLVQGLQEVGIPILGTSPESIQLAEDRSAFERLLVAIGLLAPSHATVRYQSLPAKAIRIDIDALYDGADLYLGAVMEYVERAGMHSGNSPCALPPISLGAKDIARLRVATEAIAGSLGVCGLINVQYALAGGALYVVQANPRASQTVPFVDKATAVQLVKAAARIALGATLTELRAEGVLPGEGDGSTPPDDALIAVKEVVLPWGRFPDELGRGVDRALDSETCPIGHVMAIGADFGTAFAKAQAAAYRALPAKGRVFVSVANRDKRALVLPVIALAELGFEVLATRGTAAVLRHHGVHTVVVRKHCEGPGPAGEPTIVQLIRAGLVDLVANTSFDPGETPDGYEIRAAAIDRGVPCITTVDGLAAAVQGIQSLHSSEVVVRALQEPVRSRRNLHVILPEGGS